MIEDLMKSARSVRACEECDEFFFSQGCGHPDALTRSAVCDACLRLVFKHCGERFEMLAVEWKIPLGHGLDRPLSNDEMEAIISTRKGIAAAARNAFGTEVVER